MINMRSRYRILFAAIIALTATSALSQNLTPYQQALKQRYDLFVRDWQIAQKNADKALASGSYEKWKAYQRRASEASAQANIEVSRYIATLEGAPPTNTIVEDARQRAIENERRWDRFEDRQLQERIAKGIENLQTQTRSVICTTSGYTTFCN